MALPEDPPSARPTIVPALVRVLKSWPDAMQMAYSTATDPSVDDLARLLVALRHCRAELANLADDVSHDLLALMGDKKIVVEGVGEVEAVKSTRRTKWQNHDLYVRVVALALDERQLDESTGVYESEGASVARVLEECARPSWRLGPLRDRGIDPDEWCEVDEGHWIVRLPGRDL